MSAISPSAQEVGKYLETYKSFERKPPDMIKERVDEDHMSRLNNVLTTIKGVNRTDVVTLASNYGVRSFFSLRPLSNNRSDLKSSNSH